jgi:hypothetical protein
MKRLLILTTLLLIGAKAFCQIIDPKESVKNGATNRTNDRLGQGVDKGLDKVESGIGGVFKKKHKKADGTQNVAETKPSTDSSETPAFVIVINYKHSDQQSELNAQRLYNQVLNLQNKPVTYYTSDLENANTIAASHKIVKLMGLNEIWPKINNSGNAYIIDTRNKTVVKSIKTSATDEDTLKAISTAMGSN